MTSSPLAVVLLLSTSVIGSEAWVCHSTGSDKDVCLTSETNKANWQFGQGWFGPGYQDLPGRGLRIGGGAAWGWYSYDPDLEDRVLLDR
ncbi:MAG: hypothetical protein R3D30_09970 [Hyphomicrobiales bacterium]